MIDFEKLKRDMDGKVSPIQDSIPDLKLYQMDLSEYASRQAELSDGDTYASWSKVLDLNADGSGLRSPGVVRGFYKAIIGDIWELESLALENAIGKTSHVMQFLSPHKNQQTKASTFVLEIARECISIKYEVVLLVGSEGYTNENSQQKVEDLIIDAERRGKKLWIISQGMASRSFSIPGIDLVILTYDNGGVGSTGQKISRAGTAGEDKEVAKILSCSIDGNRDDKLSHIILEAATKASEKNGTDLSHELKKARATFPLFSGNPETGILPVNEDEYIKMVMNLTSLKRLSVNNDVLFSLDEDVVNEIVDEILSEKDFNRLSETSSLPKGKRFEDDSPKQGKGSRDKSRNSMMILRKQLNSFIENVEYLSYLLDDESPSLMEIIKKSKEDEDSFDEFVSVSGMTPDTVLKCIDRKMLNIQRIDTMVIKSRSEH